MKFQPRLYGRISIYAIVFLSVLQLSARDSNNCPCPLDLKEWKAYNVYPDCYKEYEICVAELKKEYVAKTFKIDGKPVTKEEMGNILSTCYERLMTLFSGDVRRIDNYKTAKKNLGDIKKDSQ